MAPSAKQKHSSHGTISSAETFKPQHHQLSRNIQATAPSAQQKHSSHGTIFTSHFTYPIVCLTVGAPRMIVQPLFSILLCLRPFEGLHPTLILSTPLCCLPISFSVWHHQPSRNIQAMAPSAQQKHSNHGTISSAETFKPQHYQPSRNIQATAPSAQQKHSSHGTISPAETFKPQHYQPRRNSQVCSTISQTETFKSQLHLASSSQTFKPTASSCLQLTGQYI